MNMYTYHVYANDSLNSTTLHNRTGQKSELKKNAVGCYSSNRAH